jgi:hypothetical protein
VRFLAAVPLALGLAGCVTANDPEGARIIDTASKGCPETFRGHPPDDWWVYEHRNSWEVRSRSDSTVRVEVKKDGTTPPKCWVIIYD